MVVWRARTNTSVAAQHVGHTRFINNIHLGVDAVGHVASSVVTF